MSETLSREDIEYIKKCYRLFIEGDPAFFDRFEPDATMIFPETLPAGGTYRSPLDATVFWSAVAERFDDAHPEPDEFLRDGDRLVVLGHFKGRARASGEAVTIRFAHVFGLTGSEGPMRLLRFTSLELICDTAAFLAAIVGDGGD